MRDAGLKLWVPCLLATLLLSGCGITRKIAVGSIQPILDRTVTLTYRDRDVETVREAIPSNLLLLRGLSDAEPENDVLNSLTAQMYYSYGVGFIEDRDPARALLLYEEGLRIGRRSLERRDWYVRAERGAPLPDSQAVARMRREDVPVVMWTLANWASWIALNTTNPEAVAQLPRLQVYLDRALALEPDYFFGLPHVLSGALLSFRPRLFGGDPEKGRAHFEEAFRISGRKMLLFQVYYARYYCRSVLDEQCFDQTLRGVLDAPEDLLPEYRLFNEVARLKAAHLLEIKDELF